MTAATTMLIWLGSGVAFSTGALFGIWLFSRTILTDDRKNANRISQESLEALQERNRLSNLQVIWLERIAAALEQRK